YIGSPASTPKSIMPGVRPAKPAFTFRRHSGRCACAETGRTDHRLLWSVKCGLWDRRQNAIVCPTCSVLNRTRNIETHTKNRVPHHVQRAQVAVAECEVAGVHGRRDLAQEPALGRVHHNPARGNVEVAFHIGADSVRAGLKIRDYHTLA